MWCYPKTDFRSWDLSFLCPLSFHEFIPTIFSKLKFHVFIHTYYRSFTPDLFGPASLAAVFLSFHSTIWITAETKWQIRCGSNHKLGSCTSMGLLKITSNFIYSKYYDGFHLKKSDVCVWAVFGSTYVAKESYFYRLYSNRWGADPYPVRYLRLIPIDELQVSA